MQRLALALVLTLLASPLFAARRVPWSSHQWGESMVDTLFAGESDTTGAIYIADCINAVAIVTGAGTAGGGADSVSMTVQQSLDEVNWYAFTTGTVAELVLQDFDDGGLIRNPLVTDAESGSGVGLVGTTPNRYIRLIVTNASLHDSISTAPDTLVSIMAGVFGLCGNER